MIRATTHIPCLMSHTSDYLCWEMGRCGMNIKLSGRAQGEGCRCVCEHLASEHDVRMCYLSVQPAGSQERPKKQEQSRHETHMSLTVSSELNHSDLQWTMAATYKYASVYALLVSMHCKRQRTTTHTTVRSSSCSTASLRSSGPHHICSFCCWLPGTPGRSEGTQNITIGLRKHLGNLPCGQRSTNRSEPE